MADEEIDDDEIRLEGGLAFYANRGIVGIDANGRVFEGYDGTVPTEKWSPLERVALTALMMDRWANFGRAAIKEIPEEDDEGGQPA